jgi:hypothetical protein
MGEAKKSEFFSVLTASVLQMNYLTQKVPILQIYLIAIYNSSVASEWRITQIISFRQ